MAFDDYSLVKFDELNDAWLEIGDPSQLHLDFNPLSTDESFFKDHPQLKVVQALRNPDYIAYAAWVLFGFKLLPFQAAVLAELWKRPFPMMICSRGFSKTTLLALYSMLRAILVPECKIVLAGAVFRQSKQIFEYCENFWQQGPVYRSLCTSNSGPSHAIDKHVFRINDSQIIAIPVGHNGDKVRGLRANIILCVDGDTFVETNRGIMTAREVFDSGDLSIKLWDGEKFQNNSRLIKVEKPAIKISTEYGYSLTGGETHRVWTDSGWKKLNELSLGDKVKICPPEFFTSDFSYNKDYARLLGYFISEGCHNYDNICFTNTKKEVVDDIKSTLDNLQINYREYVKEAGHDKRGFDYLACSSVICKKRDLPYPEDFADVKLSWEKTVPPRMMNSNKESVREFLRALFEGDGSAYTYYDKSRSTTRLRVAYYSSSFKLIKQVQYLLLKFGIRSSITSRFENGPTKIIKSKRLQYVLALNGIWAVKFMEKIGLSCTEVDIRNIHTVYQPYNDFVRVKKIEKKTNQELFDFTVEGSHQYLSNGMISHNCDEFSSHNPQVFEQVIAGFGAVTHNPAEAVIEKFRHKKMEELGIEYEVPDERMMNQTILSGTPNYHFNHMYEYWQKYKKIVESRGDEDKLLEIFPGGIPDSFNWKDYSVIRIPWNLLPDSYMDQRTVTRAKATMNKSIFMMEYDACFTSDSSGFFRRSIIERATATDKNVDNPDWRAPWCPAPFDAQFRGEKGARYVYGIDPASEQDNLAIVILQVMKEHARIVHCWTTNRKDFEGRRGNGMTSEDGYWSFCARKVRDLMRTFPPTRIGIDAQGGGTALMEALQSKRALRDGEEPLWEVIDPEKEKPSDQFSGQHILEKIQFGNYEWLYENNYGLQKDMESRKLLFPRFDPVSIDLSIIEDKALFEKMQQQNPGIREVRFDSFEDVVVDIEELKDELTSITVEATGTGPHARLRWRVPEVKIEGNKKVRGRKDRYSALLIANGIARRIYKDIPDSEYNHYTVGSLITHGGRRGGKGEQMYSGPSWFTDGFRRA